jgi:hypothetical protein
MSGSIDAIIDHAADMQRQIYTLQGWIVGLLVSVGLVTTLLVYMAMKGRT